MKHKIIIITAGILYLFLVSCSPLIYTCSWQEKDYSSISSSEWSEPFRFHDDKSSLQYNISNDMKNLYLSIKATDITDQEKILRAGMQITIDTTGKNKNIVSILYPNLQMNKAANNQTVVRSDKKHSTNIHNKQYLTELGNFYLKGFKYISDSAINQQNEHGISITINWDSTSTLYYKAIIPFRTFYKESLSQQDNIKVFDITFKAFALSGFDRKTKKEYKYDSQDAEDYATEEDYPDKSKVNNANHQVHGLHSGGNLSSGENTIVNKSLPFEETNFKIKIKPTVK